MQHAAAFGVLHYLETVVFLSLHHMKTMWIEGEEKEGESKTPCIAWNDVSSNLRIQSCRVSLSMVLNQRCHSETVK